MREIIVIQCVNGETVNVSPLPPMLQQELVRKAHATHPPVDRASYEMDAPNAFVPGERVPAENNPAYKEAVKQRDQAVNATLQELFIDACVTVPNRSKQDVIAAYKDEIDTYIEASGSTIKPYVLAIQFGYLTTGRDFADVLLAARRDLPLTQEEVLDGVKFFRHTVQLRPVTRVIEKQSAQGAEAEAAPASRKLKRSV